MKIKRILFIFILLLGATCNTNASVDNDIDNILNMIKEEWNEFLDIIGITSDEDVQSSPNPTDDSAKKIIDKNISSSSDSSSLSPKIKKSIDESFEIIDYMQNEIERRCNNEKKNGTENPSGKNISSSSDSSSLSPIIKKSIDESFEIIDYMQNEIEKRYNNEKKDTSTPKAKENKSDVVKSKTESSKTKNISSNDIQTAPKTNNSQNWSKESVATQRTSHLKFKGVPIDGSLETFVWGMQQVGFRVQERNNSKAILSGDFAGFKDCLIYVYTLQNKDLVSNIVVHFPNREQWKQLSNDYFNLKSLLIEKYGNPTAFEESFDDEYRITSNDDKMKLFYVKDDKCKFSSTFTTPQGNIILSIEHAKYNCFVMLRYIDKKNSEDVKKHAIDDL